MLVLPVLLDVSSPDLISEAELRGELVNIGFFDYSVDLDLFFLLKYGLILRKN